MHQLELGSGDISCSRRTVEPQLVRSAYPAARRPNLTGGLPFVHSELMTRGLCLAAALPLAIVACSSGAGQVVVATKPRAAFVVPMNAVPSPSGHYHAYLRLGRLWVTDGHSVGTQLNLPVLPPTAPRLLSDRFAWSPVADVLAVVPASNDKAPGLWIVNPDGAAHLVIQTSYATSFAWSPNGARLIYTQLGGPPHLWDAGYPDGVQLANVSSGLIQSLTVRTSGSGFDLIRIADWWPDGTGFNYWLDPHRATWDSWVSAMASGLAEPIPKGDGIVMVGCDLHGQCQLRAGN